MQFVIQDYTGRFISFYFIYIFLPQVIGFVCFILRKKCVSENIDCGFVIKFKNKEGQIRYIISVKPF